MKTVKEKMKTVKDPEDWGQQPTKLVHQLSREDRAHLPHEIGFIHQLNLGREAGVSLFSKLGFPDGLFDAAHDSPSTFLDLVLVAVEGITARSRPR